MGGDRAKAPGRVDLKEEEKDDEFRDIRRLLQEIRLTLEATKKQLDSKFDPSRLTD